MEAGGVPVGAVLFDLEAGCPVSVLPRFVTLPFYWSYILPQKTSKTEQETHSSPAHGADVGEKAERESRCFPGSCPYGFGYLRSLWFCSLCGWVHVDPLRSRSCPQVRVTSRAQLLASILWFGFSS